MVIITVGYRPFPVQLAHVTDHVFIPTDKMADRKKRATSGCSTSASKRTKRHVATCEKWQRDFDRDYQSLLWLQYDVDKADRSLVDTLYHEVCRTYKDKIRFSRNFSGVWVTGSTNHNSSNIVDHGNSAQHTACMAHMQAVSARAQNKPAESYAPIVRSLLVLGKRENEAEIRNLLYPG